MKTTLELDEDKLTRLMSLTGIATRKEAVDWALTEALRIAAINQVSDAPWSPAFLKDAVDPGYDILAMRHASARYPLPRRRRAS